MKQCEFLNDVSRVNARLFNKRKINFFENSMNHDDFNLKRKTVLVLYNETFFRSFIHYLDLLNISDTGNHEKYRKIFCECPQRSAEEQLACYRLTAVLERLNSGNVLCFYR